MFYSSVRSLRSLTVLGLGLSISLSLQAATYDISAIPVKNTGDALTASEVNAIVDMLKNVRKDDLGDANVVNDRVGIGLVGGPTEMLDVGGNVKAVEFIGDGSQLTNLPNPGHWNLTANDIYYDAGKMAIGINTSPIDELEVHALQAEISVNSSGTNSLAEIGIVNDRQEWTLRTAVNNMFEIDNVTDGTTVMQIDASNNRVGILESAPAAELHVGGDIRANNFIDNSTGTPIGDGKWGDGVDINEIYYDAANVGIGTNDPNNALDVVGDVEILGHLAVGADGAVDPAYSLVVEEDHSADESRQLVRIGGTASGSVSTTQYFAGINADVVTEQTEGAGQVNVRNYFRAGAGASATYTSVAGVFGVGYNDSDAASGLGDVYGVYGSAYNQDASATIPAAYGLHGYAHTVDGTAGDITNAYGVSGSVQVDSDDGGDITNGHAGYFVTGRRGGANLMTMAKGVYSFTQGAVNAFAGDFQATDTSATTNYGIRANASGASTNNYAIWSDDGDWILDADGDGSYGGTVGGDLILGEGGDLAIYHDGTDSIIQNNTGDLALMGSNVGVGTTTPQGNFQIRSASGYAQLYVSSGDGANLILRSWRDGPLISDPAKSTIGSGITPETITFLNANGHVGILTTDPTEALDVVGNIQFSGALKRATGQVRCPAGEVLVGFDDGSDGNGGLLCEAPPQIYQ